MVPPLRFDNWQWVSLALASPVVVWAAWPFHRAAAVNARHGATTMDTLISVGVTAAYLWSLYALLFTPTGRTGWGVGGMPSADSGSPELYLEVAAVVTVLVLAGRYAEARARRRSGAALRALLRIGARRAALLRVAPDGTRTEEEVPVARLVVGDLVVVRPGGTVPTDGLVVEGHSAVDTSLVTGEPVPVEVGPGCGRGRRHRQHVGRARRARHSRRRRHHARPDRRGSSRRRRTARLRCSGSPTG